MSDKKHWIREEWSGLLVVIFVFGVFFAGIYFLTSFGGAVLGTFISFSSVAPFLYTALGYVILKQLVLDPMEKMKKRIQELENKQRKIQ